MASRGIRPLVLPKAARLVVVLRTHRPASPGCGFSPGQRAEELSSHQALAPITTLNSRLGGTRTGVGGSCHPLSAGQWVPGLLPTTTGVAGRRRSHKTGFIKGFPCCMYQEETTSLHLEERPALLFIHVSVVEMVISTKEIL